MYKPGVLDVLDNYESAKYNSAPLDMYYNNNGSSDGVGLGVGVGVSLDDGAVGGAGDSQNTEMSNFTRRKIDDLKERKRREKEEKRVSQKQMSKEPRGEEGIILLHFPI